MLPTLPKFRMLRRLLALAWPARLPFVAPDGVRPLERAGLCTAASSVLAAASLVLPNNGQSSSIVDELTTPQAHRPPLGAPNHLTRRCSLRDARRPSGTTGRTRAR
jgi:hypothetical protein